MSITAPERTQTVTCLVARRALGGVTQRQIRRLIKLSRLEAIGTGPSRRITRLSLELEVARRKKSGLHKQQRGHSASAIAEKGTSLLDGKPNHAENVPMRLPIANIGALGMQAELPVAELLSVPRAAALVGISDQRLRNAIRRRQVPSVEVGARRMIDADALREWARGERGEK